MISVDEAVGRVVAAFKPTEAETVAIGACAGRVLAENAIARVTQPPAPVSAMDGYAVRTNDAAAGARLRIAGTAPAGHPFDGEVGKGEAVRIFTGGVVPDGADAIVIQEDTKSDGDVVVIEETPRRGQHIRKAGLDFKADDVLLEAGSRISARNLSLLAAGDLPTLRVRRKPVIAVAATGDELSRPGEPRGPGGIVASSIYGLAALIELSGGAVRDLGIVPDTVEAVANIARDAEGTDLIVTLGGASVGEHDLIQRALGPQGFERDFWKIAMRPGKPLIFGRLGTTPLLGLPGNPVSTYVCALLFLRPAIFAMLGRTDATPMMRARLSTRLPANGTRQDYIRTRIIWRDGEPWAEPFALQDSAMQSVLARADGLIVRPAGTPASAAGEWVDLLVLDD